MPINRDLWQQSREQGGSGSESIGGHAPSSVGVPSSGHEQQPIINLHVNTGPQTSSAEASGIFADDSELRGLRESIRDLESRLDSSSSEAKHPTETVAQSPQFIVVSNEKPDITLPPARRKWPYVAAAILAVGGLVLYTKRDEIRSAACERSEKFCFEEELAGRGEVIEGIPQESDNQSESGGGYVPVEPNTPSSGDGSGSSESRPAPQYEYPQQPTGGDGEFAPGLPTDPSDGPILITNTPAQSNSQTSVDLEAQLQNLSRQDANYLLKLTPEGVFVPDEETFVEWQTLEDDPSGQAFKIQLREIENNRYLSDQSFGRFLNSESLTDEELLQFLFVNRIVPQSAPILYVEFVGEDEDSVIRTLTFRSAG